jgi:lycopene cyclase domain-containing protein
MTYAQFLLVFLVLPIGLIGLIARRHLHKHHGWACAAVCLLAFLYTAPWDNHAARIGLWSFDPHFAPPSHFLLFLPWEEYAFYGLQGILTCLVVVVLACVFRPRDGGSL